MKTLTKTLLVAAVAGLTALNVTAENEGGPPGQQKKGGVPPGLQKKGGLPPGQAKKRGNSDSSDEKAVAAATNSSPGTTTVKAREAVTPATTTEPQIAKPAPETPKGPVDPQVAKPSGGQLPPPGDGISKTPDATAKPAPRLSREATEKRERLQQYITELDSMGQQAEVRDRLMVRLYKNIDVPISTLQAQQKANPGVGIGGLYIAHGIARKSRQSADSILAEHKAGKSWPAIADAHKVPISDLIESAQGAKESARVAEKEAARR